MVGTRQSGLKMFTCPNCQALSGVHGRPLANFAFETQKEARRQGNADRCRQGEGRNGLRPSVRLRGSPATLPSCPNRLLYAGNDLGRARAEFEAAIKHRPRIKLTIRQRTRVLQQWPGPS
jgi:hypothetical protein